MKLLKAYLFGELQKEARERVEAGAFMYACGMMTQGRDCPPHLYPTAFQTFQDEFLGGCFTPDGLQRFSPGSLVGAEDKGNVQAPVIPIPVPLPPAAGKPAAPTPGAGEDGPPATAP